MRKPNIFVVIPARNEEKTIKKIIQETYEVNKKNNLGNMKILVVDDASVDNTGNIAKKFAYKVVRGEGKGLGTAIYFGLLEALKFNPDIIVSIDADGQADPKEIPNFVKPIINNKADLVIGSRFLKPGLIKYKMELSHLIGTKILVWMLRLLTKLPITDSHGGIRAMRKEVAENLELVGTHTYVQETIIDAAQKGFRILEIPSTWRKRLYGKTKVVSSIKRYAIWTLPTLLLRAGTHMMIFSISGILLTLIGFLTGLYLIFIKTQGTKIGVDLYPYLMLVILFIFIGFQLFFFGYLINLIINLKNKLDKMYRTLKQ